MTRMERNIIDQTWRQANYEPPILQAGTESQFQWRGILRVWLRASVFLLPLAAAGGVGGYALSFGMTPVYETGAVLLLDRASPGRLDNAADNTNPDAQQRASLVNSQVEILRSTDVVRRVITALDLAHSPVLNPPPGLIQDWVGRARLMLGLSKPQPAPSPEAVQNGLITSFLSHLTVEQEADTYVINVGFRASDPDLAARATNSEVANYIAWSREQKEQAINHARSWLTRSLAEAHGRVLAAEGAVQAFNAQGVVLNVDGRTALDQGLAQLTTDLARAQATEVESQAQAAEIRRLQQSGQIGGIAALSGSQSLQTLQGEYATAAASEAALRSNYGASYPQAAAAGARAGAVKAAVDAEIARYVAGVTSQATVAQATVTNLSAALDQMKQKVIAAVGDRATLGRLEGVAAAENANYLAILQKLRSYDDVDSLAQADVTILSQAATPTIAIAPRRGLLAALGFLITGALGALAVIWHQGRRDVVRDASDAASLTGLRCLGIMPQLALRRRGEINRRDVSYSFFREELRAICASLMRESIARASKGISVMVSSSLPGEGKSTFCRELGRFAAQNGVRTLIVRADTVGGERGKAVQRRQAADEDLPLFFVDWTAPASTLGANSPAGVIEAWQRDYGFVIIDTPPLSAMAESVILAPLVDSTIVLAHADSTPRSLLASVASQIEQAGGHIIGLVITFVDLARQKGTAPSDPAYYFHRNLSYHHRLVASRKAGQV